MKDAVLLGYRYVKTVAANALLRAFVALPALFGPLNAAENPFAGRPGLAEAERQPASLATCDSLQRTLADFENPTRRVDLWAIGPVTLVHTDGTLWYLAVCSSSGIRVMCITYSDNGMKLGERVTLKGAVRMQDKRHAVLDPCLATRS